MRRLSELNRRERKRKEPPPPPQLAGVVNSIHIAHLRDIGADLADIDSFGVVLAYSGVCRLCQLAPNLKSPIKYSVHSARAPCELEFGTGIDAMKAPTRVQCGPIIHATNCETIE